MSQGHFVVKSVVDLENAKVGEKISESDFATLTPQGKFVQLEYVEVEEKAEPYLLKPGIWSIKASSSGMKLEPTTFVSDDILDNFVSTKDIETRIDCFFRNLDKYAFFKIEVPRRAMLLFGPPGLGKTTSIIKVSNKYVADKETAVIIWSTDKYDAYQVKEFFKSFEYGSVKKVILIAEDIGGVEIDQVRMKSDSSLLSLLDNKEKTFKCPIFIIATTNFAENFLGNLTNRPGRFDDKVEVKYPDGPARKELLKFFGKGTIKEEDLDLITDKMYKEFSPAHLQEVVIRSMIFEQSIADTMVEIAKEIEYFKNAFTKRSRLGISSDE